MTPETLSKLNDFRSRIIKARDLRAAKAEVPAELEPSDNEIRDAIMALRDDRMRAVQEAGSKAKPAPTIPPTMDLNELFKKPQ